MMTRTQIYLPEETHSNLVFLAKTEKVSLSELIRMGADLVIKTKLRGQSPNRQVLEMLADYPDSKRQILTNSAVDLIRNQRN